MKVWVPQEKRERNSNGDFVVTSINIPDLKIAVEEVKENSDSDEESEQEEPVEEVKEVVVKAAVK